MQFATSTVSGANAAFAGASVAAKRSRRHSAVVVRADDAFCRDKVSLGGNSAVEVEGTSTVVFLGAGGQQVEIQAPKVGAQGSHSRPCLEHTATFTHLHTTHHVLASPLSWPAGHLHP